MVRVAVATDRDALAALAAAALADGAGARGTAHRLASQPSSPEHLVDAMLAPTGATTLVAEIDEELCGFALILTDPPRLVATFVAPEARRRGVARALVKAAETTAASWGSVELTVIAAAGNRAEKSLYEALGYRAELLTMAARRPSSTVVNRSHE
jgi:GNAT superfamily N-acetyltransferase